MTLQSVGINNFTCPIRIRKKSTGMQQTIATINLQADMPVDNMGSCITVMTKLLAEYAQDIHAGILQSLLKKVKKQLQAKKAQLEMSFPYFIPKQAPVSGTSSLMEYKCSIVGTTEKSGMPLLAVKVPVTTLCPCSKEISTAGAHNQRAEITLTVQPLHFIWLEDLIKMVEHCGSCELYALLKRTDEKHVTEKAYANPMFVEDVARMVSEQAINNPAIDWFSVGVESFESIHKHSAYAYVDYNDL